MKTEIIQHYMTNERFTILRDGEHEGWRGYLRLRDRLGREFWASKRNVAFNSTPVQSKR